jgi:D-lactate dehydrogenase (cytochrome)
MFQTHIPVDFLRDESRKTGTAEAIAFPQTVAGLADLVREAAARGQHITVQGARTGISAGAVPDGGVIVSLTKMDRILGTRSDARGSVFIRVQPGLPLVALRRYLSADCHLPPDDSCPAMPSDLRLPTSRVFFPPDPTEASASLGGMAACNASGACSFAYGPTRAHIESLRVVLADGDSLTLRRGQNYAEGLRFSLATDGGRLIAGVLPDYRMPQVKNAAGYWIKPDMDLLDLFIGCEGTLGIIAELELRLSPKPAATLGVLCYFPDEARALTFVEAMRIQAASCAPHSLVALEYFDDGALGLIRSGTVRTGLLLPPSKPHWCVALYAEWALQNLHDDAPLELTSRLLTVCGGHPDDTWTATDSPALEKLKTFRHAVPEQVNALIAERKRHYPELTKLGTDLSVPDDRLAPVMRLYRTGLNAAGLEHVIFGHIGNNHVHVNILPRNMEDYAAGKALYREWAEQVVAWGGSISAEHGVGRLKKEMLALMYGPGGIGAMRRLKALFDPDGLLNPGRLF